MSQVQQQQVAPATYDFSAEPRVIKSKSKYRDQRGIRSSGSNEGGPPASQSSGQKTNTLLSKVTNRDFRGELQGFEEPALEEIVDRPVDDTNKLIPYYFVDRPPTPDYRPLPKGRDIETQVQDYELFDYPLEVKPILEVLVGRTLEQSRIELLEEYEAEQELQHKREFEKRRNAELMVTQRKENEWLRKEAERKRRQKQHTIQDEDKRITHQKYIARIFAKGIIYGMRDQSLQTLNDQGVLRHERPITFRASYLPYLYKYANRDLNLRQYLKSAIQELSGVAQTQLVDTHGSVVKAELDRRQNIRDERQREAERIERERRERRERRRRLRIFYAKKALREEIEEKIVKIGKDVDDIFAFDVTDISGNGIAKETISIVGGYIAELCFLLQTITTVSGKPIADQAHLVKFLTVFFNDVLKQEKFDIFVPDIYQAIFEEFERAMLHDLVEFNKNKDENIALFLAQIPALNSAESLSILNEAGLFDPQTFNLLNTALLSLYFSSVDYKPPEKKIPQQNQDADPSQAQDAGQGDGADGNVQVDGDIDPNAGADDGALPDGGDGDQQGDAQDGQDAGDQGARDQQPAVDQQAGAQGDQPQAQQVPEEEWKAPEITEEDLLRVKARERLRLVFVPTPDPEDQYLDNKPQYKSVLRMRLPLDRELHTVRSQDTHVSQTSKQIKGDGKIDLKGKPEDKRTGAQSKAHDAKQKEVVEEVKLELPVEEKRQLPPEPEDFIEPYDGQTFEKHRNFYPEIEISPEGPQTRAFNHQLIPEKKFAQSNHRGQLALTKSLLHLFKEFFPELAALKHDEEIIAKMREVYLKAENAVLAQIIQSYDDTPVFDYEIY